MPCPSTRLWWPRRFGSYKPAAGHWLEFSARTGANPAAHVHVAASLFHDIGPANELGLPSVWINRLGETPGPTPTRELPDLSRLPDTIDELVPGRLVAGGTSRLPQTPSTGPLRGRSCASAGVTGDRALRSKIVVAMAETRIDVQVEHKQAAAG